MGSDVSTEETCSYNNTFYVPSAVVASTVGLLFSDFEKTCTAIVLPIILTVGVVGNTAFLFTVARVPVMRTATNFYLSNLAVADLMFLFMSICQTLHTFVTYGLPNDAPLLGQIGCVLKIFFKYVFNFVGLILVTFISLERYIAVCHPLHHRLVAGRGRSFRLVMACWLAALILALLVIPAGFKFVQYCFVWNPDDPGLLDMFPYVIGTCTFINLTWAPKMLHLTQTVPFFIAFFGNAFFYSRILFKLHKRDAYDRQRIVRTRNQVAVMLVANGTVFFLTLTSFEMTSFLLFVEGFLDGDKIIPVDIRVNLFEINRILVYINSAVNPIVYTVTNASYRRAFKEAFTVGFCKPKPERQRASTVTSITSAQDIRPADGNASSANQPPTPVRRGGRQDIYHFNASFEHDLEATEADKAQQGSIEI